MDRPWCGWCGEQLFGDYEVNDPFRHHSEATLTHADGRPSAHTHGIWVRWDTRSPGPGLSSEVPGLSELPFAPPSPRSFTRTKRSA